MKKAEWWPILLFAGWLVTSPAWSQEPGPEWKEATKGNGPSLELLEFLGEFETDEGEWIDPEELDQMESIDELDKSQESNEDRD